MVCAKKTKSAAAVVATAASSVYQAYNGTSSAPGSTGTGVAPFVPANTSTLAATSSVTTSANSGVKGFNYGAFFMDYSAKKQADFQYEFERAQDLTNTTGWTSARLYTMSK